ncbi:mucin-12-like [Liolophura sinensis]|uniref:mucin-12-like n=1 Tax=Liolophura sinensis TaxID=3198878 RepID=UPI003159442A
MAIRGFYTYKVFIIAMVSLFQSQDVTADPCALTTTLDAWERDITLALSSPDRGLCDRGLLEGWYMFENKQKPMQIPTQCLRQNICGTGLPYWLDLGEGGMLPGQGQQVNASFCASFDVLGSVDCCVLRMPTQVHNCGNGFAYYLRPTDRCPVAYCAYDPTQGLNSMYITQRGQNSSELTTLGPASDASSGDDVKPTKGSTKPGVTELKSTTPVSTEARTSVAQDLVLNVTSSATPGPEQGKDSSNDSSALQDSGDVSPGDLARVIQSGDQAPENKTVNSTVESITGVQSNVDSNQTSSPTSVNLSPTSTATYDLGFEQAGSSILDKTVRVPNRTPSTPDTAAQATTVGIYPGEMLVEPTQPSSKAPSVTDSDAPMDAATKASITSKTAVPKVTVTISTMQQQTTKPGPVTPVSGTVSTVKTDTPGSVETPPEVATKALEVATEAATKASVVTPARSTSARSTPVIAHSSTVHDQTSAATITVLNQTVTKPVPSTNSEAGTISQKQVTQAPQTGTIDPSVIAKESILLKITGKKITSERVKEALIQGILRRCQVGLHTASHSVKQVFFKYNLCDTFSRRKRREATGLEPVLTGSFNDESGTFHSNVALTKTNGTSATVISQEDLLTLFQDEEIADTFLSEVGVSEAEVCAQKTGDCKVVKSTNSTSHKEIHIKEGEDTFRSYLTLIIAMTVIGSLCLIIIIVGLVYMRCSNRGSWNNDYNSIERSRLDGKMKNTSAIENPASDAEIMKDEGEMREKDGDPLTSVNGSPHCNYPDDDNGWVVPYDQLTMEERALPGVADTKL